MKQLFILSIIILSFSELLAGGDYPSRSIFEVYERKNNILYVSVEDTINYLDQKQKLKTSRGIGNIAIYDIKSESTTYLFKDSLHQTITGLYFENQFDEVNKNILFNGYNYSSEITNNENLQPREVSQNIIIVTYSYSTDMFTVWTADKHGNNLTKFGEIKEMNKLHIDVLNRTIRIIEQVDDHIIIKNKNY